MDLSCASHEALGVDALDHLWLTQMSTTLLDAAAQPRLS